MSNAIIQLPARRGESIDIEAHGVKGTIKHHESGDYVFSIETIRDRKRWGNAEQIRQDVSCFLETGSLPAATFFL